MGLEIEPNHNGINEYLGELYIVTNRIDLAKERLKVLESCNCEEYNELKEIIAGTKNLNINQMLDIQDPIEARKIIRENKYTEQTAGSANRYVQGNLCILPSKYAMDFASFLSKKSKTLSINWFRY